MALSDPIVWIILAIVAFFFFIFLLVRRTLVNFREGVDRGRNR